MMPRLALALALALPLGTTDGQSVPAPPGTVISDNAAAPSRVTARASDVHALVAGAVDWLVTNQSSRGSWGSHQSPRPIEVLATVPGSHHAFQVATTALCVIALEDSPYRPPAAREAADLGIDYLLEHFNVKRPNGFEFYCTWSFAYTMQCLGEWLSRHPDDPRKKPMHEVIGQLIRKAGIYQTPGGGWGYLDFNARTFHPSWTYMSFTTASMLVGLDRVQGLGLDLPDTLIEKAVRAVERTRTPEGNFLYGNYLRYVPRAGINQAKGSACRTPLCLYTLERFGREVPLAAKQRALDNLLVHYTGLQRIASRRPIPHESWYSISGYFYLYGHAYAAYLLAEMPAPVQARLWPAMIDALRHCHQPDGSFWDYPLYSYHKPYGTAFALIALARAPETVEDTAPD